MIRHCLAALSRGRKKAQADRNLSGTAGRRLLAVQSHGVAVTAARICALAIASTLISAIPAGAAGNHNPGAPSSKVSTAPASSASALLGPLEGLLGSLPGTHALPTTAWPGYWLTSDAGGVGSYGGTSFDGSLSGINLDAPVVGMAATPDGQGYWLVAGDGGVFAFGNAPFFGSAGGKSLDQQMVGIASTPDGRGYWLVAADGGVFAFGDARYFGSAGGKTLDQPVVGMAATSDGQGYWLVAGDGGVFAFGDARYFGSAKGTTLDQQVVGMAATPDGQGYWLAAADGGVFSFGDATFFGSIGGKTLDQRVVGIAAAPNGQGYWLAAADGGVFAFGSAPFRGSGSGDVPSGESVSALVSGPGIQGVTHPAGDFTTQEATVNPPYAHGAVGYDISFPQCHKHYPPRSSVAVVGANNGSAFTVNPCFSSEANWAGTSLTVYLNLNSPQPTDSAQWVRGPDGDCMSGDPICRSYNYGFNTAERSIAFVRSAGYNPQTWWLDVETSNVWTSDISANDEVIAGALAAIRLAGGAPAIYSTDYQWNQIAGDYLPNVPAWYATGVATFFPQDWCSRTSFAGGPVYLVQGRAGSFDGAYSC